MFRTLDISTSGLVAQRHRMDTIAGNIANLNTTRDEQGNLVPFRRRFVAFMAQKEGDAAKRRGVGVDFTVEIDEDAVPRKTYQPGHPDADEKGIVSYPGIDLTTEFVNAMEASRAYEANVGAIEIAKAMNSQTLRILA
jgi:flagellar basal-body rod protein FlgC